MHFTYNILFVSYKSHTVAVVLSPSSLLLNFSSLVLNPSLLVLKLRIQTEVTSIKKSGPASAHVVVDGITDISSEEIHSEDASATALEMPFVFKNVWLTMLMAGVDC